MRPDVFRVRPGADAKQLRADDQWRRGGAATASSDGRSPAAARNLTRGKLPRQHGVLDKSHDDQADMDVGLIVVLS